MVVSSTPIVACGPVGDGSTGCGAATDKKRLNAHNKTETNWPVMKMHHAVLVKCALGPRLLLQHVDRSNPAPLGHVCHRLPPKRERCVPKIMRAANR